MEQNICESDNFIYFMLKMIDKAVSEIETTVGINDGVNDGINLTEQDSLILRQMKSTPHISAQKLAKVLNKSPSTIERRIKFLKDKQIIERIGSNKSGYWNIIRRI